MKSVEQTTRRAACALLLSVSATFAFTHSAHAQPVLATWKPNTVGDWNVDANWIGTPTFPNNSGTTTYNVLINSSLSVCSLNLPITIDRLTLTSGTLTSSVGGATLTVLQAATWSGGNIGGAGTINLNGSTLNLNGINKGFSGFSINASASTRTVWSAGTINSSATSAGGAVFNNSGTFADQTTAGWIWSGGQTPVFNNLAGANYQGNGAMMVKEFHPVMNNAGTLNGSGVWFSGGGIHTGTLSNGGEVRISDRNETHAGAGAPTTTFLASSTIASGSGSTINFSHSGSSSSNTDIFGKYDGSWTVIDPGTAGNVRFRPGARVDKTAGPFLRNWIVHSGRVSFDSGQEGNVQMGALHLEGGECAGSDVREVNATFIWSGGALSGNGTNFMRTRGGILIDGDAGQPRHLVNLALVNFNSSVAEHMGGTISMNGGRITNNAGATWIIVNGSDAMFVNVNTGTISQFLNNGTFNVLDNINPSELRDVRFVNTNGIVQVQDALLRLGGGGTNQGTMSLTGVSTLTLDDSTLGPVVEHVIDGINGRGVITGSAGSTLRIAGQTRLINAGSINVGRVRVDGTLAIDDGAMNTGSLAVFGGGSVRLTADANKVLRAGSLSIDTATNSTADLFDNHAIVRNGNYATIAGYIASARNGGAWDGAGIPSTSARESTPTSTTLGAMSGADFLAVYGAGATFQGVPVAAADTLVSYTYYGDTDLNGTVNFDDYARIDSGFNNGGSAWFEGDFDYNGVINFDDYALIDLAFNTQTLGLRSVPEPVSTAFFLSTLYGLQRMRTRSPRVENKDRKESH